MSIAYGDINLSAEFWKTGLKVKKVKGANNVLKTQKTPPQLFFPLKENPTAGSHLHCSFLFCNTLARLLFEILSKYLSNSRQGTVYNII